MNPKALPAYLAERFPPINMALFAILFATVYSVASVYSAAGAYKEISGFGVDSHFPGTAAAADWSWREMLGIVATISFFFRLRVFDEIKDYELDLYNHPQRVLQSGRISLRELMLLSLLGTALEIAWSAMMGLPALLSWALAFGYSLLMRYEFFAGYFLKKRLLLYAITHMLVMPLMILWIWSAYAPYTGDGYAQLALLSLLAGFSFELARKIHAPAAERPRVDSYSKSMGYDNAILAVLLVLLGGVLVQTYLLYAIDASPWSFLLILLLYLATLALYLYTLQQADEKRLRRGEKLVSLFMLASYLSIILEINL